MQGNFTATERVVVNLYCQLSLRTTEFAVYMEVGYLLGMSFKRGSAILMWEEVY